MKIPESIKSVEEAYKPKRTKIIRKVEIMREFAALEILIIKLFIKGVCSFSL